MSEDWATGPEWEEFAAYQRSHTVKAMESSAYVMSLIPSADKVDVKFAVELGMAIMMDKPIIAMVQPGIPVPARLRKVVDAIIVADLDTEAGRQQATRQLKEFTARFSDRLQPPALEVEHDRGVHHAVHLRGLRVTVVVPGAASAQHRREPDHHLPFVEAGLPGRGDVPPDLRGHRHVLPVFTVPHSILLVVGLVT